MREIPEDEYRKWSTIYDKAAATINGRSEALDKAAEMIERDLFLLGATAIEDKLQEGVPDTIYTLQQAGIKIWVLTGDRQETAINIGLSCRLISESMSLVSPISALGSLSLLMVFGLQVIVNEENALDTRDFLTKRLEAVKNSRNAGDFEELALVIGELRCFASRRFAADGVLAQTGRVSDSPSRRTSPRSSSSSPSCARLSFAVRPSTIFLDSLTDCVRPPGRVSPLQKALVVKLVKKNLKAILLAIGDGANDVSMIQAAHVGVGISGVEGLQAARSADVAISQFRFLKKLLLVHGTWSYQRLSKLILYSCVGFSSSFRSSLTVVWSQLLQEHHPLHDRILGLWPPSCARNGR